MASKAEGMRIAIVTTQCPFVIGGAELHAESLKRELRKAGHDVDIVSMPYKWYPPQVVLDHMLAARCIDISEFNGVKIDLAICLKFPAYLMQHPNKVFWILHQERAAYDLWDTGLSHFFHHDDGELVRSAIRQADNTELGQAKRVFANSKNIAKRLIEHNGIMAEPLYHPPPLAERLHTGAFGAYFYYPSRITGIKRQDFVLKALAFTKAPCRVVFSGAFESVEHEKQLKDLASKLGVQDRIEWRGFVNEEEMIDLYANARAILFTPVDEDLGYVALEAMLAGKPLLTLEDSGEPVNLMRHEIEGLVSAVDPAAYAKLMDRLFTDEQCAKRLGAAAAARYQSLNISWDSTIKQLTAPFHQPVAGYQMPAQMSQTTPAQTQINAEGPKRQAIQAKPRAPALWQHRTAAVMRELEQLFSQYDFGVPLAGVRSYLTTHWPRYQATLDALQRSGIKPRRILDLGISPPYVFAALLCKLYPDAELFGLQESPAGHMWQETVAGRSPNAASIHLKLAGLNVETTALPYEDDYFDLVLGMDILEHLAIDPGFVFREAARVTRKGGGFFISSPNLVSWQAILRALNGMSPYSSGVFVPWHGIHGRHNREYTPHEVEELGRYAGFETALLDTVDGSQQEAVPTALLNRFADDDFPADLRGQDIFYIGRKTGLAAQMDNYPNSLFQLDPAIFDGRLELGQGGKPSEFIVGITNRSPLPWRATGQNRIRLCVDRIDQSGFVQKDVLGFALPHDIAPQKRTEMRLEATKDLGKPGCWFEIGLYVDSIGPFKAVGRTNTVSIFAETLALNG